MTAQRRRQQQPQRSPPSLASALRSAWSASPMPRCRSTACSARSPALAARRSAPKPHRRQVLDRKIIACASTPMSRRRCRWDFKPVQRHQTVQIGETALAFYHGHQSRHRRRSPARRPSTSRPTQAGHLFQQDPVLLLHRADAAAGRDRRHAGRLLRRSGDRRRSGPEERARRSRCPTPSSRPIRTTVQTSSAGRQAGKDTVN